VALADASPAAASITNEVESSLRQAADMVDVVFTFPPARRSMLSARASATNLQEESRTGNLA
jgi:hypothetical protein